MKSMAGEIFFVSIVFWIALLILYVLFNRQLSRLTQQVGDLERSRKK